jgi:hypothetical protein
MRISTSNRALCNDLIIYERILINVPAANSLHEADADSTLDKT